MTICRMCGSNDDVRRGLCRGCRELPGTKGEDRQREHALADQPPEPQREPSHDRRHPGLHRG